MTARAASLALALLALLALASCGTAASGVPIVDDDAGDATADLGGFDVSVADATADVRSDAPDASGASDTGRDPDDDTDTSPLPDAAGDTAVPDTAPAEGAFGAPCEDGDDCDSALCMPVAGDGRDICTQPCDTSCPPAYDCRVLRDTGGDLFRVCVAPFTSLCAPCERDVDCGGLGATCVLDLYPEGGRCADACTRDSDCAEDFVCDNQQCVAMLGTCEACYDADGDMFGIGTDCLGEDCDDTDRNVWSTAQPEVCDGVDNNCNARIDEGFDLAVDERNCGACGVVCPTPDDGAEVQCVGGDCVVVSCPEGYRDIDGDPANGCEAPVNACGGTAELDGSPGDSCDPCGGVLACEGPDVLLCRPGATGLNECGGCGELTGAAGSPGDACGTCSSGRLRCADENTLVCEGDMGDEARNDCGGCSTLAETPGDVCGGCLDQAWVCAGPDLVVCSGESTLNSCDGCNPLRHEPGSPCGFCEDEPGEYICLGSNATLCDSSCAMRIAPDTRDRVELDGYAFYFADGTTLAERAEAGEACWVSWTENMPEPAASLSGVQVPMTIGSEPWVVRGPVLPPIPEGYPARGCNAEPCRGQGLPYRFAIIRCGDDPVFGRYLAIGLPGDPRSSAFVAELVDTNCNPAIGGSVGWSPERGYYGNAREAMADLCPAR